MDTQPSEEWAAFSNGFKNKRRKMELIDPSTETLICCHGSIKITHNEWHWTINNTMKNLVDSVYEASNSDLWKHFFLQWECFSLWLKELLSAPTVSCRGLSMMDFSFRKILLSPPIVPDFRGHPRTELDLRISLSVWVNVYMATTLVNLSIKGSRWRPAGTTCFGWGIWLVRW